MAKGTSSSGGKVEGDPQTEMTDVDVAFPLLFACLFLFPSSIYFIHTSEPDSNLEVIKNEDFCRTNNLNSHKQPRSPLKVLPIIYNIPLLKACRKVNSCGNIYHGRAISLRNPDTGQQQLVWNLSLTRTQSTDWKIKTMQLNTFYGYLLHCINQARDDQGACSFRKYNHYIYTVVYCTPRNFVFRFEPERVLSVEYPETIWNLNPLLN